uniref:Uncharacterized protein n=1 Tax=Paramoeba aestuarina TaxID=180227 RepID=A0A7S4L0J4_9EUKA|mmetsp:Transcript_29396/g.45441  ORF Transcript_29396/g.45441 Transcript_29396/m.45441 type:complete len:259 (+) Transcript_29396:31-807(+)
MHSLLFNIFSTADTSCPLGRVDFSSLSQQALMEIFIQNVKYTATFKDSSESFLDIEKWPGLKLNEDGQVVEIYFAFAIALGGSVDFEAIPSTATRIGVAHANCSGEIPWGKLFNDVRYFAVDSNAFYGTIDLTIMPRNLIGLFCSINKFSGTLNFAKLPEKLAMLDVSTNELSGTIDLRRVQNMISSFTEQHLEYEQNNRDPPSDMPFGCSFQDNTFHGDVLVNDNELVAEVCPFWKNSCSHVVDADGRRKRIYNDAP